VYRDNPEAIHSLVEDDRVHRDAYVNPEVFELERERVFAKSWLYVGHESQVPQNGDYTTMDLVGQPVIMVRHADGTIRVLLNRCAHKGSMLVSRESGSTGKFFRCPYHAWTYRTDGAPLARPLEDGYRETRLRGSRSGEGLTAVAVAVHRGFVFARLSPEGQSFEDYCGSMTAVLDNFADRSPQGQLRIAGGCLRSVIRCNWKIYLENVNDAVHPVSTHESVSRAARAVAATLPAGTTMPMVLEQLLPFGASYEFFEGAGARVLPNGHSIFGTKAGIHSDYSELAGYAGTMQAAYGPERAQAILSFAPQNSILFPSLALKSSLQTLRVLRPLSVDRTLVEIWALEAVGAPEALLRRTLTYNRLAFSPMSMVAHDDIHVFESIQRALMAEGNPWVSLHREHTADESSRSDADVSGTNEWLMRNQFRAWARLMASEPWPLTAI